MKNILLSFISLVFSFFIPLFIPDVHASTIPLNATYSSTIRQELYNTGSDNWISCSNSSCPLWSYNGDGVPSWLSVKANFDLIQNTTYFLDVTITFNYSNNSNTSIPIWKLSKFATSGQYLPMINRGQISCDLSSSTIDAMKETYSWSCSFSPTSSYSDFEFYLWTDRNYDVLTGGGQFAFLEGNSSYYTINKFQLSKLDGSTNTIIAQNETIINNIDKTNDKLDGIQGALTDDSSVDMSSLGNTVGWLPSGPVDSILTLPLTMLNSLVSNLSNNSCQSVSVELPFVHKNLTLPCVRSLYDKMGVTGTLFTTVGVIVSAFILFNYLLSLYKWVDDTLSMRENTMPGYFDDNWGGGA